LGEEKKGEKMSHAAMIEAKQLRGWWAITSRERLESVQKEGKEAPSFRGTKKSLGRKGEHYYEKSKVLGRRALLQYIQTNAKGSGSV